MNELKTPCRNHPFVNTVSLRLLRIVIQCTSGESPVFPDDIARRRQIASPWPGLQVQRLLSRSRRILLTVPILVCGKYPSEDPFSERTHTVVVNAHGALIQLCERVFAGKKLRLKNLTTNEEINCEVIDINLGNSTKPEVGVEFSEPYPRSWHVSFPPPESQGTGNQTSILPDHLPKAVPGQRIQLQHPRPTANSPCSPAPYSRISP